MQPRAFTNVTRAPGAHTNVPNRMAMVPAVETPRSVFDRSHGLKTTFDAGYLIPIMVDEVLPGDTFNLKSTLLARLNTPIVPIMDSMFLETFYFFVPTRLVWSNFQKFMGEQDNPTDSIDYLIPTMIGGTPTVQSLYDYMGIPPGINTASEPINALPFRAYNRIYNEWFRDQNLQPSVPLPLGDGPDPGANYTLLRRGKRHDYFTSCLPWPQKGPGIELPLGSTAPIIFNAASNGPGVGPGNAALAYDIEQGTTPVAQGAGYVGVGGTFLSGGSGGIGYTIDVSKNHLVDLSAATAATINSLRQAFQLQRMLERDARGGTRYIELLRAHFNVVSPDARLQRTEYLGGGRSDINIHPVPQTGSTDEISPQGHLAAMGLAVSGNNGFNKSFTEHGYIIGLASVRADLTYQQGLAKLWSRRTKHDFYWPALAHLGEQAVLSKELYFAGGDAPEDQLVFGYQERWAEYRYAPSRITGKLRSNVADSLDVWHLAQNFSARPLLNAGFITEDPPIDRVVAVPTEPHFTVDIFNRLTCTRVMPTYSVPGLIDHF